MPRAFFVSDLHGAAGRYDALFAAIREEAPAGVFLGGDLLPGGSFHLGGLDHDHRDFIDDFLAPRLEQLRADLAGRYPRVFVILGNDDPRFEEAAVLDVATRGLWHYVHARKVTWDEFTVYGYACVPPTPFRLKDWERYDVSRYVDPGCVGPDEGALTVPVPAHELRRATIDEELRELAGRDDVARSIILCHAPPYQTCLDRADLDGQTVDYAPLDVHVGSIALRRFIEARQPLLTLHGHIHESPRLTGAWQDRLGRTVMLSAAHDGPELALVRFDPSDPEAATRELIATGR